MTATATPTPPAEKYTNPREYLNEALKLVGDVPDLEEIASLIECITDAIGSGARDDVKANVETLRKVEKAMNEAHCLIDNYIAETAIDDQIELAERVLDHERGIVEWSDVVAHARRLAG
jgi:hypothetical protein